MTRIQPQNIEIEEQVLGIILNHPKVFVTAINIINTNCFYRHEHQTVFNAFVSLYSQSKPIDLVSVTTLLRNNNQLDNIGGNFFLMELMERSNSYNSLEYYCHVLLELCERREGIEKSTKLIENLYDLSTDIDENMGIANEVVLSLSNEVSDIGGQSVSKALLELHREQEEELRGIFNGCRTNYADLDRLIMGIKNQQVAILAGRPGSGKTTFALNIAYRLAKYNKKAVGIFSLETSKTALTKKFAEIETQIPLGNIRQLEENRLQEYFRKSGALGDLPIYIDDTNNLTIEKLRSRAITMKRKNDIKLIVIDYLGLIETKSRNSNREQQISEISRKIKILAKELDISIIALAQLNRKVEDKDDKIPQIHHLRDSGSIEQDADMVWMIFRPEMHEMPEITIKGKVESSENKLVLYVRKNRNGETGGVALRHNLSVSSVYDLDEGVESFLLPNTDF